MNSIGLCHCGGRSAETQLVGARRRQDYVGEKIKGKEPFSATASTSSRKKSPKLQVASFTYYHQHASQSSISTLAIISLYKALT